MELNEKHLKTPESTIRRAERVSFGQHFKQKNYSEYKPGKDQPELSEPQLISKHNNKNTPTEPPKAFKYKLLSNYRQKIGK